MRHVFSLGLCASVFAASSSLVLAAPADDFLERLNLLLEPMRGSFETAPVSGKTKSDSITLTHPVLVGPRESIRLGDTMTLGPIESQPGGTLRTDLVTISGLNHFEDGLAVSVDTIRLVNVRLPEPEAINALRLMQLANAVGLQDVRVNYRGAIFELDQFTFANSSEPVNGGDFPDVVSVSFTVEGLLINEAVYDLAELSEIPGSDVALMGRKIDLALSGTWVAENGNFNFHEARISIPGMGSYSLGIDVLGVTRPLLEELAALGADQVDGSAMDSAAQQAVGMKVLAQVSLVGAQTTLVDEGVVPFIIGAQRQDTGQTVDEVEFMVLDGVDDLLDEVGAPQAAVEAAVTAVSGLLDQGGTLRVETAPATPVSLIELVALAQSPALLFDKLGLSFVHEP